MFLEIYLLKNFISWLDPRPPTPIIQLLFFTTFITSKSLSLSLSLSLYIYIYIYHARAWSSTMWRVVWVVFHLVFHFTPSSNQWQKVKRFGSTPFSSSWTFHFKFIHPFNVSFSCYNTYYFIYSRFKKYWRAKRERERESMPRRVWHWLLF